jgi:hypothetical protein
MSNEDNMLKKMPEKIDWPAWKDENGNDVTEPSLWSSEWYIDPGEPKESCHVKMTYKGEKLYFFLYTDIVERLENDTLRSFIDEITGDVQTDEDFEEIDTFFQHYVRSVDSHGGGQTWELDDDAVDEDGPKDYHIPYNGPEPTDED